MSSVRNTILKMKGLQTRQTVTPSYIVGSNGVSAYGYWYNGQPSAIQSMTGMTSGSDEKVYLRTMSTKIIVANGTNVRLIVRMYKCVSRKNTSGDFWGTVNDDVLPVTTSTMPYTDTTTSTGFRRYWKITKRKVKYLDVGSCFTLGMKKFWRGGKPISGDVEANTGITAVRGFTQVWLILADTIPMEDVASGLTVGTGVPKLNVIQTRKVTYYLDEDNDPSSTATSGVSVVVGNYRTYTDVTLVNEATDGP